MKRHIPNGLTCCNLISGCISVSCSFEGEPLWAMAWIIMGAIFDFFDGMVARLLRVSSPIGKELDSLADVVTFGVAPSVMVFMELAVMDYPVVFETVSIGGLGVHELLPYIAFLMAAFSALRLAKFNLDERQSMGFIGLPTPANALFWASFIVGGSQWFESSPWMSVFLILLLLVRCWLLVSEIPMFALKFKHWGWQGNEVKYIFVITSILILLLAGVVGIAAVMAWYIVLSVATARK